MKWGEERPSLQGITDMIQLDLSFTHPARGSDIDPLTTPNHTHILFCFTSSLISMPYTQTTEADMSQTCSPVILDMFPPPSLSLFLLFSLSLFHPSPHSLFSFSGRISSFTLSLFCTVFLLLSQGATVFCCLLFQQNSLIG